MASWHRQTIRRVWCTPVLVKHSIEQITANNGGTQVDGTHINHTSSDVRLKRDIRRVGWLPNRLPLCRFRYLASDIEYLGVMAQDVLTIMPEAVIEADDGYLRVDYRKIGMPMIDLSKRPSRH